MRLAAAVEAESEEVKKQAAVTDARASKAARAAAASRTVADAAKAKSKAADAAAAETQTVAAAELEVRFVSTRVYTRSFALSTQLGPLIWSVH